MGTRQVAAEEMLPDVNHTAESAALQLKPPHLNNAGRQASLNGRQAELVEQDHELDGYSTSATDDTQQAVAQPQPIAHGPSSLEDMIMDSPFLDLSSPMTAYEWFKVVIMLPWIVFKTLLSIAGLILVWAVTRVRTSARPAHHHCSSQPGRPPPLDLTSKRHCITGSSISCQPFCRSVSTASALMSNESYHQILAL